jgi:hypothetical protein
LILAVIKMSALGQSPGLTRQPLASALVKGNFQTVPACAGMSKGAICDIAGLSKMKEAADEAF